MYSVNIDRNLATMTSPPLHHNTTNITTNRYTKVSLPHSILYCIFQRTPQYHITINPSTVSLYQSLKSLYPSLHTLNSAIYRISSRRKKESSSGKKEQKVAFGRCATVINIKLPRCTSNASHIHAGSIALYRKSYVNGNRS